MTENAAQLKVCYAKISELKTKYNVKTVAELEKKIERGAVEEHPAWEDMILLENLEERIRGIRKEVSGT